MTDSPIDAIIVVSFGGPEGPEEVPGAVPLVLPLPGEVLGAVPRALLEEGARRGGAGRLLAGRTSQK